MVPKAATSVLFLLFGVAGLVFGGHALWQNWALGVRRAHVPEVCNAIVFGDLALLLGLLCVGGLPWLFWRLRRAQGFLDGLVGLGLVLVVALGAAGGVLAAVLSGSRGAWIVIPPALLVLYGLQWRRWAWPAQAVLGLLVALLLSGAYALPQTGVAERLAPLRVAVVAAMDGEVTEVFWARPTLYRVVAGELIPARPVLGHGRGALPGELRRLADAGGDEPTRSAYLQRLATSRHVWHAHNDVLQAWFVWGLPGLALLLMAYGLPLVWFIRRRHATDMARQAVVTAGVLVPVTFMGFGLTYSLFAYPLPWLVYAGLVGSLMVAGNSSNE
jgi:O-antigen ligase